MACHGRHVYPCAVAWYLLIKIIAGSCLHEESKRQKIALNVHKRSLLKVLNNTNKAFV